MKILRTMGITALLVSGLLASQGLEAKKAMESDSHQKRISILQTADKCIKSATTQEEYKACEKMEKKERTTFKAESFETRKKNVLKRIDDRMERANKKIAEMRAGLEKVKSCIINATNNKELQKCKPKKKSKRLSK